MVLVLRSAYMFIPTSLYLWLQSSEYCGSFGPANQVSALNHHIYSGFIIYIYIYICDVHDITSCTPIFTAPVHTWEPQLVQLVIDTFVLAAEKWKHEISCFLSLLFLNVLNDFWSSLLKNRKTVSQWVSSSCTLHEWSSEENPWNLGFPEYYWVWGNYFKNWCLLPTPETPKATQVQNSMTFTL